MGMLLTLEHGEKRAVFDVGSADEDFLILFSQKELSDVARAAGHLLTTAEVVDLKARAKFGKQVAHVLGYRKEEGTPTKAGELRRAAEEILEWCNGQGEPLRYVYLKSERVPFQMEYTGFSKGIVSGKLINGEIFWVDVGLGLCELQRVGVRPDGNCMVVERRDLRGDVVKGLDRIATDNQGDVLLKCRKVVMRLPSILKAVAEFAAKFSPDDTITVSYRRPQGKKHRNQEEEEGDL